MVTAVGYHTKVVAIFRPRKWLFIWSSYMIFRESLVSKRVSS